MADDREILLMRLGESNARIRHEMRSIQTTGLFRQMDPLQQVMADFMGRFVRVLRKPFTPMHQHGARSRFPQQIRHHIEIAFKAAHVVHNHGSRLDSRYGDRPFARVDADRNIRLPAQFFYHGNDAAHLFIRRHRRVAWPCRFTADIQNLRAIRDHFQAVLDRYVHIHIPPAVRKRIRRHVQDSHDARTAVAQDFLVAALEFI